MDLIKKLKKHDFKEISKVVEISVICLLIVFFLGYFAMGRSLNIHREAMLISVGLLFSFFVFFRKRIGERPEVAFFVIAIICGSLLIYSEPKEFNSWDEQIHFKRVERLATGIIKSLPARPNVVHTSYSIEEQKKINAIVDSRYKKPKTKSPSDNFSYKSVAYIPSVTALVTGNLLHLPPHIVFLFGRWMNLFAYALVVYFAIKKLKSGKMIMSVVALFPTSIFLASNYGYDSWVTAFTMFGLAYLFSELQQPEKIISKKEMAIMIGAFVIGLGPKAIYFPLMFLLFLLGKNKFASLKQYKGFLIACILSILFVFGSFMLPFVIGGPGKGDMRGGSDVNATLQTKFILTQPWEYTKILTNFMVDYVNPQNAAGYVSFFAYLGMTSGFWLLLTIVAIVTFLDKNTYDRITSNWKMRIFVISIFFVTVSLICSALYVSFTPLKSATIGGVQPRYLIPLAFPLLFVLGSSRIKNPINKNIFNIVIFAIMAAVLINGIWELMIRKYY